MAGYFIYSFAAEPFLNLVMNPAPEACTVMAESIVDDLEDLMEDYDDEDAADPKKWPTNVKKLAAIIRKRLASPDWYGDMSTGDAAIWDHMLYEFVTGPGDEFGLDFRSDNDGMLYWDAPIRAAKAGATMMAEPAFGNHGFRISDAARSDHDLIYTIYLPDQVKALLAQLEAIIPVFEALPDEPEGERAEFFQGLLDPVRTIVAENRVMWVQTDT